MDKNLRLNKKATMRVLDDLLRGGFISSHVVKDGDLGKGDGLDVSWTKEGTQMIACYARAYAAIRQPTNRQVNAFHLLLGRTAKVYLQKKGEI